MLRLLSYYSVAVIVSGIFGHSTYLEVGSLAQFKMAALNKNGQFKEMLLEPL